jgi:uncharacterized protein YbjQ (UPF0145 family)
MLVTTTPIVEGRRVVKYIGIVVGQTLTPIKIFRGISTRAEMLEMSRQQAIDQMIEKASKMGANAIVGVNLHQIVGWAETMILTAVVVE